MTSADPIEFEFKLRRKAWTVVATRHHEKPAYWTATVRELPGLVTEGPTMNELRKNLAEAIILYLEDNPPESFWAEIRRREKEPADVPLEEVGRRIR